MPPEARCNFEEDWCGWYGVEEAALKWTRENGTTNAGLDDHTYGNETGTYLHVQAVNNRDGFSSTGTLNSQIFNPPPRVHGNLSSLYYNSCMVQFYVFSSLQIKNGFDDNNINTIR